jgi:hypothetical protein
LDRKLVPSTLELLNHATQHQWRNSIQNGLWHHAVIPVEIGQPTLRLMYPAENNEQLLREDSDLVDEVREIARIKEL